MMEFVENIENNLKKQAEVTGEGTDAPENKVRSQKQSSPDNTEELIVPMTKEDISDHLSEFLDKARKKVYRIYLRPGEQPPPGHTAIVGPRGKRYYETDERMPAEPRDWLKPKIPQIPVIPPQIQKPLEKPKEEEEKEPKERKPLERIPHAGEIIPELHKPQFLEEKPTEEEVIQDVLPEEYPEIKIPEFETPLLYDSDLNLVSSSQLGSNPGGMYEDKNGEKYYVKFPKNDPPNPKNINDINVKSGKERATQETLASRLYQLAGVPVAKVREASIKGQAAVASHWIKGAKNVNQIEMSKARDVLDNFVIDAWLANWDVVGTGYDNIIKGEDGRYYRIDMGGSLEFRAQGKVKYPQETPPYGEYTIGLPDTVDELETLRDKNVNPYSYSVFGELSDLELKEQSMKLAAISDDMILRTIDSTDMSPAIAGLFLEKLKKRRDYIVNKYAHIKEPMKISAYPYYKPLKDELGITELEAEEIGVDKIPDLFWETLSAQTPDKAQSKGESLFNFVKNIYTKIFGLKEKDIGMSCWGYKDGTCCKNSIAYMSYCYSERNNISFEEAVQEMFDRYVSVAKKWGESTRIDGYHLDNESDRQAYIPSLIEEKDKYKSYWEAQKKIINHFFPKGKKITLYRCASFKEAVRKDGDPLYFNVGDKVRLDPKGYMITRWTQAKSNASGWGNGNIKYIFKIELDSPEDIVFLQSIGTHNFKHENEVGLVNADKYDITIAETYGVPEEYAKIQDASNKLKADIEKAKGQLNPEDKKWINSILENITPDDYVSNVKTKDFIDFVMWLGADEKSAISLSKNNVAAIEWLHESPKSPYFKGDITINKWKKNWNKTLTDPTMGVESLVNYTMLYNFENKDKLGYFADFIGMNQNEKEEILNTTDSDQAHELFTNYLNSSKNSPLYIMPVTGDSYKQYSKIIEDKKYSYEIAGHILKLKNEGNLKDSIGILSMAGIPKLKAENMMGLHTDVTGYQYESTIRDEISNILTNKFNIDKYKPITPSPAVVTKVPDISETVSAINYAINKPDSSPNKLSESMYFMLKKFPNDEETVTNALKHLGMKKIAAQNAYKLLHSGNITLFYSKINSYVKNNWLIIKDIPIYNKNINECNNGKELTDRMFVDMNSATNFLKYSGFTPTQIEKATNPEEWKKLAEDYKNDKISYDEMDIKRKEILDKSKVYVAEKLQKKWYPEDKVSKDWKKIWNPSHGIFTNNAQPPADTLKVYNGVIKDAKTALELTQFVRQKFGYNTMIDFLKKIGMTDENISEFSALAFSNEREKYIAKWMTDRWSDIKQGIGIEPLKKLPDVDSTGWKDIWNPEDMTKGKFFISAYEPKDVDKVIAGVIQESNTPTKLAETIHIKFSTHSQALILRNKLGMTKEEFLDIYKKTTNKGEQLGKLQLWMMTHWDEIKGKQQASQPEKFLTGNPPKIDGVSMLSYNSKGSDATIEKTAKVFEYIISSSKTPEDLWDTIYTVIPSETYNDFVTTYCPGFDSYHYPFDFKGIKQYIKDHFDDIKSGWIEEKEPEKKEELKINWDFVYNYNTLHNNKETTDKVINFMIENSQNIEELWNHLYYDVGSGLYNEFAKKYAPHINKNDYEEIRNYITDNWEYIKGGVKPSKVEYDEKPSFFDMGSYYDNRTSEENNQVFSYLINKLDNPRDFYNYINYKIDHEAWDDFWVKQGFEVSELIYIDKTNWLKEHWSELKEKYSGKQKSPFKPNKGFIPDTGQDNIINDLINKYNDPFNFYQYINYNNKFGMDTFNYFLDKYGFDIKSKTGLDNWIKENWSALKQSVQEGYENPEEPNKEREEPQVPEEEPIEPPEEGSWQEIWNPSAGGTFNYEDHESKDVYIVFDGVIEDSGKPKELSEFIIDRFSNETCNKFLEMSGAIKEEMSLMKGVGSEDIKAIEKFVDEHWQDIKNYTGENAWKRIWNEDMSPTPILNKGDYTDLQINIVFDGMEKEAGSPEKMYDFIWNHCDYDAIEQYLYGKGFKVDEIDDILDSKQDTISKKYAILDALKKIYSNKVEKMLIKSMKEEKPVLSFSSKGEDWFKDHRDSMKPQIFRLIREMRELEKQEQDDNLKEREEK